MRGVWGGLKLHYLLQLLQHLLLLERLAHQGCAAQCQSWSCSRSLGSAAWHSGCCRQNLPLCIQAADTQQCHSTGSQTSAPGCEPFCATALCHSKALQVWRAGSGTLLFLHMHHVNKHMCSKTSGLSKACGKRQKWCSRRCTARQMPRGASVSSADMLWWFLRLQLHCSVNGAQRLLTLLAVMHLVCRQHKLWRPHKNSLARQHKLWRPHKNSQTRQHILEAVAHASTHTQSWDSTCVDAVQCGSLWSSADSELAGQVQTVSWLVQCRQGAYQTPVEGPRLPAPQ